MQYTLLDITKILDIKMFPSLKTYPQKGIRCIHIRLVLSESQKRVSKNQINEMEKVLVAFLSLFQILLPETHYK